MRFTAGPLLRPPSEAVSALVKHFLVELAGSGSDTERLKREEQSLRQRIGSFRAADRLPREDLHGRQE
jgi:hypothetical protein